MTTYRLWSGLRTIGGNIVEVRTEKARVLCDFGLSVSADVPESKQPQSELENFLQAKRLPAIPELFPTDDFEKLELAGFEEATLETALFISHLHLDHMGALRFLPEGVHVYLSEDSLKLFHLLVEVGEEDPVDCQLHSYEPGETIQVGDITVTPHLSDHDALGTTAFFIESDDLKLIHSGDFRFNGNYPERVTEWAEKARDWHPDVLLIEGTSYSFDDEEEDNEVLEETEIILEEQVEMDPLSEETLLDAVADTVNTHASDIVVFNPYIRNVERLAFIKEVVTERGRTMVWEEPYAYVLSGFYPDRTWTILEETKTGKLDDSLVEQSVSLDAIKENPGDYVLQNSYKNLSYLDGFTQGVYIHSNGEPLGDYNPRYQEMLEQLEQFGLTFLSLGASGHANRDEIIEVAKTVSARHTLPWHSFKPESLHAALVENGIESFVPELNKEYRA